MGFNALFLRLFAVFAKEVQQMLRDRLTFATMVAVPVLQIVIFGYAVNTDPHHLNTAVVVEDKGFDVENGKSVLEHTGYFRIVSIDADRAGAERMLRRGKVAFVLRVPPNFTADVFAEKKPLIYVEADASDPLIAAAPIAALERIPPNLAADDPTGRWSKDRPPFDVATTRLYNPDGRTATNIVPGLIGLILTQTMVLIVALSMTRETERGTFEVLLASGISAPEIMVGKILPYVFVGYAQLALVLVAAPVLFNVPMAGSYLDLTAATTIFILANLSIGFAIATLCRRQFQAMQATFFFFLPSVMLTGFLFPFEAMPAWARVLGDGLPNTYFLRIVRGVMLKGSSLTDLAPDVWALAGLAGLAVLTAMASYRRTLD
jgi:ABC-2 type transport system permease protein